MKALFQSWLHRYLSDPQAVILALLLVAALRTLWLRRERHSRTAAVLTLARARRAQGSGSEALVLYDTPGWRAARAPGVAFVLHNCAALLRNGAHAGPAPQAGRSTSRRKHLLSPCCMPITPGACRWHATCCNAQYYRLRSRGSPARVNVL